MAISFPLVLISVYNKIVQILSSLLWLRSVKKVIKSYVINIRGIVEIIIIKLIYKRHSYKCVRGVETIGYRFDEPRNETMQVPVPVSA